MNLQKRFPILLALVVALLVVALAPLPRNNTAQASHSNVGIVCTENPSATFTLTTKTGYISMPDGNTLFMWSYTEGDNNFQYPGPILCVNEGDTVTVVLHNTLPVPTSLIFPGQVDVLANGVPDQPVFSGSELTSLATMAAAGGSVTYSFVAEEPGTYMYTSGTDPEFQMQMGMFGVIVVRPAGHPNWVYNRADSEFKPDTEYVSILSEIDPIMHQAVENGALSYDMTQYRARYWMVNGRAFPDTLAPNHASWLPAQPYSALARIHPHDPVVNPLPALVRYASAGSVDYPYHPHGNNGRLVGRDGRALEGPLAQDLSYEKFSVVISPLQTWDSFFTWQDVDGWDPDTNPVPVTIPGEQNLTFGQFYSGSPYLGNTEPLPPGATSYNVCGEYYHIAHSHALQHATAWGLTMSGMATFTRIDPPLPNFCP